MKAAKLYKTYNTVLKVVIVVLAAYFLVDQLFIDRGLQELFSLLSEISTRSRFIVMLIVVVALMPVNWGLEARKWKTVVAAKETISLWVAFKAVLAGVTISSLTPNRTGEFLGRIFVLKKHSFWEGTLITVVGSYAQTLNTFFWGLLGVLILVWPYAPQEGWPLFWLWGTAALAALAMILAVLFYFKISLLTKLVNPRHQKVYKVVAILRKVDNATLLKVLGLSALRYFVFSFQFFLLLTGSGLRLSPAHGFMLIATMFLFNTIRPSVALLEIGLRTWSALLIFQYYFQYYHHTEIYHRAELLAATGFIWLINIVLPAIIGLLFVKDLRFFKKNKGL